MNWLEKLFEAQLTIGSQAILWREIVGNGFGFASAIGGMRRRVWAWPVGIVGNVLLFTVFFGVAFSTPQHTTLLGQAGRQVFFIITSIYGWWRWSQVRKGRHQGSDAPAITPRWATTGERIGFITVWLVGMVVVQWAFRHIGLGFPPPDWYHWADAWIFVGSIIATYAMARGWNEFWLCWIAVDLVGVPTLLKFHFYPSAVLYGVYGLLVIYGFFVWLKASREEQVPAAELADATEASGATA
jgi:nicotinamide mononucleotide transporter